MKIKLKYAEKQPKAAEREKTMSNRSPEEEFCHDLGARVHNASTGLHDCELRRNK
jgi:hypothetical protein